MPDNIKYISVDRLTEFLTQLKTKYAGNTASALADDFAVLYAQRAINNEDGQPIKSTYATKTELQTLDGSVVKSISFTPSGASAAQTLSPTSGVISLDLSGYALKTEVSKVMDYKGSKTGQELNAIKTGTITEALNGDVYTCSDAATSPYKQYYEYVANVYEENDALKLEWIELGNWIDVSGYAHKLTSTANGHIAQFDANGDLADTGQPATLIVPGNVTSDGSSFVTGATVYSFVQGALGGDVIHDVKVKVDSGTATSVKNASNEAIIQLDGTVTSNSSNPVTSGAVYTALGNLSKVVEDDGTTHIAVLQEASSAEITALFNPPSNQNSGS